MSFKSSSNKLHVNKHLILTYKIDIIIAIGFYTKFKMMIIVVLHPENTKLLQQLLGVWPSSVSLNCECRINTQLSCLIVTLLLKQQPLVGRLVAIALFSSLFCSKLQNREEKLQTGKTTNSCEQNPMATFLLQSVHDRSHLNSCSMTSIASSKSFPH